MPWWQSCVGGGPAWSDSIVGVTCLWHLDDQAREQAAAAGSGGSGGNGANGGEGGESGAVVERKRFAEARPISAAFEGAMLVVYIAREASPLKPKPKLLPDPFYRLLS